MATKQSRKTTSEPQFEDFEPVSELQESPEKYILLVNLPGFKKEDFRVQVDGLFNLTVKGQKLIGENKFKRFHSVFRLPHDSDLEKISGKFEGETLSLSLPRKEIVAEKKQEVKEPPKEEEKREDQMEEPKEEEKREDKMEEPKTSDKEQVDPREDQQKRNNGEGQAQNNSEENKPIIQEKKEESRTIKDKIHDKMMKMNEDKKTTNWKQRISQEMQELSNKVTIDSLLETLNKNKKEIGIGIAAFSIGFLVSRKLSCNK